MYRGILVLTEAVLKGRVGLATGVNWRKGIGLAIAQRLARLGADVFIHSFIPYDASQTWESELDSMGKLG